MSRAGDVYQFPVFFLSPDLATDGVITALTIGKSSADAMSALIGFRFDTTSGDEGAFITMSGDSAGTGLFVQKGGNVGIGTLHLA